MQARYYDPVIGRFLSIDPVTFMDTGSPSYFNRYRYCSNDPVNCTDPSGQSDWIPNFFSEMFKEESSQALGNFVERSMPAGSQMDTGDPDAPVRGMVDPVSEADAVGATGGAVMAAMDGVVEGYVQSQTMAIGGGGRGAASAAGAATKAVPKIGSAGGPGAGANFAKSTQDAARAASGNRCVFCQQPTVRSPTPVGNRSNIDHAIPKVRGGNNSAANAQNTCQTCNLRKATHTTEEFINRGN